MRVKGKRQYYTWHKLELGLINESVGIVSICKFLSDIVIIYETNIVLTIVIKPALTANLMQFVVSQYLWRKSSSLWKYSHRTKLSTCLRKDDLWAHRNWAGKQWNLVMFSETPIFSLKNYSVCTNTCWKPKIHFYF